ncbi:MAG: hypothetical protein QXQ53_04445 [Candidatus Methanosuratincola sp.]
MQAIFVREKVSLRSINVDPYIVIPASNPILTDPLVSDMYMPLIYDKYIYWPGVQAVLPVEAPGRVIVEIDGIRYGTTTTSAKAILGMLQKRGHDLILTNDRILNATKVVRIYEDGSERKIEVIDTRPVYDGATSSLELLCLAACLNMYEYPRLPWYFDNGRNVFNLRYCHADQVSEVIAQITQRWPEVKALDGEKYRVNPARIVALRYTGTSFGGDYYNLIFDNDASWSSVIVNLHTNDLEEEIFRIFADYPLLWDGSEMLFNLTRIRGIEKCKDDCVQVVGPIRRLRDHHYLVYLDRKASPSPCPGAYEIKDMIELFGGEGLWVAESISSRLGITTGM